MAAAQVYRRRSPVSFVLVALSLLVLAVGGTAGTLWALGYIGPGKASSAEAAKVNAKEGKVQVLMSGINIPAYTKVTRDHLVNPQTKEAASFYLAKEQVPPGVILELAEIAGRVMKHDKPAGFFFTEDDFLPKGTRPGMTAGIPAGKRSITLEASKIQGVSGLKAGDRFDVVSSLAVDAKKPDNAPAAKLLGQAAARAAPAAGKPEKEARLRVVIDNGAVVMPVYLRAIPTTSHSLTSGVQNSAKPVQEIVLAIEPAEVVKLAEAIALGAELTAVARSGLPSDDPGTQITIEVPKPAPPPPPPPVIEVIRGKRRESVAVPGKEPQA